MDMNRKRAQVRIIIQVVTLAVSIAACGLILGAAISDAAPTRIAAHATWHAWTARSIAPHRSIWAIHWSQQHPAQEAAYQKGLVNRRWRSPRYYRQPLWTAGRVLHWVPARHARRAIWRRDESVWITGASLTSPTGPTRPTTPSLQTRQGTRAVSKVAVAGNADGSGVKVAMAPPPTNASILADLRSASAAPSMVTPPAAVVPALQATSSQTSLTGQTSSTMPSPAAPTAMPMRVASSDVPTSPVKVIVDDTDPEVSLDFVGADINDVLKSLAMQTHTNIVSGSDVHGIVTVSLTHVTLQESLDMISKLSGFQYAKVGRTYVVGTPTSIQTLTGVDTTAAVPDLETRTIRFHYADAEKLTTAINKLFPEVLTMYIQYTNGSLSDVHTDSGGAAAAASGVAGGAGSQAASGVGGASATGSSVTTESQKYLQGGGVIVVKGVKSDLDAVAQFISEVDDKLIDSIDNARTTVYNIKYMAAKDLINTLNTVIPSVVVIEGPAPGFSLMAPTTADAGGVTSTTTDYSSSASSSSAPASTTTVSTVGGAGYTLILTGTDADIKRALDLLAEVDVQPAQISYDAKVTEINLNNQHNLGLNWSFTGANTTIGETSAGTTAPNTVLGSAGNIVRFGVIGRTPVSNLVNVSLDAVFNDSDTKVLADPNISAVDGQQAAVFIGDTVYYVSSITQTATGPSVTTGQVSVGIKLFVAGKVSNDGYVTVNLHPEVSTISSWLAVPGGGQLPQISSREASTTVRVKDGDYIAIGGLINEQDVKTIQKVPGLGDIPFFGSLFRDTQNTHQRDEIVIFVKVSIAKNAD
jgi:type II secretory pathway component GspD/PulD (secretin)